MTQGNGHGGDRVPSTLVRDAAERAGRERARRRRRLTPLLEPADAATTGHYAPGDRARDDEHHHGHSADARADPPPAPGIDAAEEQPAGDEPTADQGETGQRGSEERGTGQPHAGLPPLLADALDLVLRRMSGDYVVDEFGFDPELATRVLFPLLRPLSERWFRVDVRGAEHIPDTGPALLVSNHSGTLPWDGLMTQLAVHDATPSRRIMRPLAADLMFATPVVGDVARRVGATLAAAADAERLLRAGELVGVWPEGFKGIGKLYRDRYRLQRFGRGGFVSSAIRTGVPIIPVSVVGAEETYPMLADVAPLAKLTGMPYWPLTPTWPWLGPLGLVPMPSKWIIDFGVPVPTDGHSPSDADDPMVVLEMTDHVREIIQRTLYALLVQRGPAFG